jgi:hypothetical protein
MIGCFASFGMSNISDVTPDTVSFGQQTVHGEKSLDGCGPVWQLC